MSHITRAKHLLLTVLLGGSLALSACSSPDQGAQAPVDEPQETVSIAVIGPNAAGDDSAYAEEREYALDDVEDAWDLSQKAFEDAGLDYDASNSDYGVMLNSITNPVVGTTLAWDEATGDFWQLFVDGASSEVGIDGVELKDGTSVVWYYSAFGEGLPEGELAPVETLADAA